MSFLVHFLDFSEVGPSPFIYHQPLSSISQFPLRSIPKTQTLQERRHLSLKGFLVWQGPLVHGFVDRGTPTAFYFQF